VCVGGKEGPLIGRNAAPPGRRGRSFFRFQIGPGRLTRSYLLDSPGHTLSIVPDPAAAAAGSSGGVAGEYAAAAEDANALGGDVGAAGRGRGVQQAQRLR
jgi:hypothetical protein